MTGQSADFGANDLGGPKDTPPSGSSDPTSDLTNEQITRKKWSRHFALGTLIVMATSAIACLGFAMYVGCHFLGVIDNYNQHMTAESPSASAHPAPINTQPAPNGEVEPVNTDSGNPPGSPEKPDTDEAATTKHAEPRNPYLSLLAPLIPASFSSALAIILFITTARFATNFERIGKEGDGKEHPEDYGAIAALVQEIGKMIQTLRGK
tara:strand:+ start:1042 stop:1665 length:624 start_codon:yes stop_codon:yes gene_type:complete